jgi:hypothetical protein
VRGIAVDEPARSTRGRAAFTQLGRTAGVRRGSGARCAVGRAAVRRTASTIRLASTGSAGSVGIAARCRGVSAVSLALSWVGLGFAAAEHEESCRTGCYADAPKASHHRQFSLQGASIVQREKATTSGAAFAVESSE